LCLCNCLCFAQLLGAWRGRSHYVSTKVKCDHIYHTRYPASNSQYILGLERLTVRPV
jgi:hypothetical protein